MSARLTALGAAITIALCGSSAIAAAADTAAPTTLTARVPEGTEVRLHLDERLSSSTSAAGDTFVVILDEPIKLPDGTVIPAGYTGRGEVTQAEHNGMLGKSGQLAIRMDYLKIGDERIHLRANKATEGKSGVGNTVAVTILVGPLGLLVHGHSVVYPKGTPLTAFVDEDAAVALPLPPVPAVD